MEAKEHVCDRCGAPARVRILLRYSDGAPVFKLYCLDCADAEVDDESDGVDKPPRQGLGVSWIPILAGVLIGVVALLIDHVAVPAESGFGWKQTLIAGLGAAVVLVGVLVRVDVIVLSGLIVFTLTVFAETLGITGEPGIGWRQQSALALAGMLVTVGLVARFVARRR